MTWRRRRKRRRRRRGGGGEEEEEEEGEEEYEGEVGLCANEDHNHEMCSCNRGIMAPRGCRYVEQFWSSAGQNGRWRRSTGSGTVSQISRPSDGWHGRELCIHFLGSGEDGDRRNKTRHAFGSPCQTIIPIQQGPFAVPASLQAENEWIMIETLDRER